MNIYAHRKGLKVEMLSSAYGNYLTVGFPGGSEANVDDFLEPIADVAGMEAEVTAVVSHGSYPYTRYSLQLANGGHVTDAMEGLDFCWK